MVEVVYLWATKDRAEGKLVAPAPALSEALELAGVQHLVNLTIPTSQVKFDMPVRS